MDHLVLDHIAIAVASIAEAVSTFELLTGECRSPTEELPAQGVNVAFVGSLELLEPRGMDTTVGRFLERRGPGLHHIAYRVPDLEGALAEFTKSGFRAIDEEPRKGARGHLVAFLHPGDTGGVLIELVQR